MRAFMIETLVNLNKMEFGIEDLLNNKNYKVRKALFNALTEQLFPNNLAQRIVEIIEVNVNSDFINDIELFDLTINVNKNILIKMLNLMYSNMDSVSEDDLILMIKGNFSIVYTG